MDYICLRVGQFMADGGSGLIGLLAVRVAMEVSAGEIGIAQIRLRYGVATNAVGKNFNERDVTVTSVLVSSC